MDEIVKAALSKWPGVPHCYGWLALDARGQWFMRDDRTQAAGPFPQVKGSRIEHDKLLAFIQRNYGHDEQGCWYFQNGPQRVYVELEATPWVWSVEGESVIAHTLERPRRIDEVLLDELGRLYVATDIGLGIVRSLDMHAAAGLVESGRWQPREVRLAELPARHGYVRSPQQRAAGGPRC